MKNYNTTFFLGQEKGLPDETITSILILNLNELLVQYSLKSIDQSIYIQTVHIDYEIITRLCLHLFAIMFKFLRAISKETLLR